MDRQGEIIIFNDSDKRRYPRFPAWTLIEMIPGIYEQLSQAYEVTFREMEDLNGCDVFDIPEHERVSRTAKVGQKLGDLGTVKARLAELAAEEIAAANIDDSIEAMGIDDLDTIRLHEE